MEAWHYIIAFVSILKSSEHTTTRKCSILGQRSVKWSQHNGSSKHIVLLHESCKIAYCNKEFLWNRQINLHRCSQSSQYASLWQQKNTVQIVRTIPVWLGMKMVMMFMTPDNSKKKIKGLLLPILQNKNANKYQVMLTSTNKVFYAFN